MMSIFGASILATRCPQCDMELSADIPLGLCPKCLLKERLVESNTISIVSSSSEGSPPPMIVGRRLGDYDLIAELARGGMGVVYKARQISLNRTVALKIILKGDFASAEEVQRFRSEAEAAANLDHPNILPVYDVGQEENWHYFSMKLIDGGSLEQTLTSAPLPSQDCARLMVTVARAVHHAHQHGILHRDLKPGNILMDKSGEPHV